MAFGKYVGWISVFITNEDYYISCTEILQLIGTLFIMIFIMPELDTENAAVTLDPKVEELFRAGVHFGYAKMRRHPRMREFIAGVKSNVEIFNLEKVEELLEKALAFIEEIGKENGTILWVGTKAAAEESIRAVAQALGHPYVDRRWVGGTLTNFDVIHKRILYWQDLVTKQKTGELEKYTKQERLIIQKKIDRLAGTFDGLVNFQGTAKAMFIVDTIEETNALHEAKLKRIPIIALLNSDCDPEGISMPIPGNDNAPESIRFILSKAQEAYQRGKEHGNQS